MGGNLNVDVSSDDTNRLTGVQNTGEDAVGGNISVNVFGGGNLTVAGTTALDADARGGVGDIENGLSDAGDISISLSGTDSLINLVGATTIDAEGERPDTGFGQRPDIGSDSFGGNVVVNLQDGAMTTGDVAIDTDGFASQGIDSSIEQSNDASAGDISIDITGGAHNFANLSTSFGGRRSGSV